MNSWPRFFSWVTNFGSPGPLHNAGRTPCWLLGILAGFSRSLSDEHGCPAWVMMLSRIAAAGVAKIKLPSPRAFFECAAGAGGAGRVAGASEAGGAFNLTRSWHPQLSTGVKLLAELSAAWVCVCAMCTCCTVSSSVTVENPANRVAVTCALC